MNTKYLIPTFFIFLQIAIVSCTTTKKNASSHFQLSDAYYYSWVANENEKGTDIFVVINKIDANVHFDSIIFRKVRIPAFATEEGNKTIIKGILPSGFSRIKIDTQADSRSDQLIYTLDEEKYYLPLLSLRREEMKYYRIPKRKN